MVDTSSSKYRNYAAKSIRAKKPGVSLEQARKFVNEYYQYAGGSKYKDYIENKLSKRRDPSLSVPQPHEYASRMTGFYSMQNIERHYAAHGDNLPSRPLSSYDIEARERKNGKIIAHAQAHGYKDMLKERGKIYHNHKGVQYKVTVYNTRYNRWVKR